MGHFKCNDGLEKRAAMMGMRGTGERFMTEFPFDIKDNLNLSSFQQ